MKREDCHYYRVMRKGKPEHEVVLLHPDEVLVYGESCWCKPRRYSCFRHALNATRKLS